MDPGWPPFEFVDQAGNHHGMTAGYLEIISRKLKVAFQVVKNEDNTPMSWTEVLAAARRKKVDLVPVKNARQGLSAVAGGGAG